METYNGKPAFRVGFIDFCKLATRKPGCRVELECNELKEHMIKTRYSKEYVVIFGDYMITPYKGTTKC